MSTETTPSNVLVDLMDRFKAREAIGLGKYGMTLDRIDLSAADLRQHLLEELMDACMYLVAEQHANSRLSPDEPVAWIDHTAGGVFLRTLGSCNRLEDLPHGTRLYTAPAAQEAAKPVGELDAERYRKLRAAQLGEPGVACIALPTSKCSGDFVNGAEADAAVDELPLPDPTKSLEWKLRDALIPFEIAHNVCGPDTEYAKGYGDACGDIVEAVKPLFEPPMEGK